MARATYRKTPSKRRSPIKSIHGFGAQMAKLGGDELIKYLAKQGVKHVKQQSETRTKEAEKRKGRRTYKYTTGEYVGRFSRKKSKVFQTEGIYASRGCTSSVEVRGTVADPNVTWIGHSTFAVDEITRLFLMAVYRRLFEKAFKKKIESVTDLLTNLNAGSNGCVITVYYYTSASNVLTTSYTLGAGDTLNTLATATNAVSARILADDDQHNKYQISHLTLQNPAAVGIGIIAEIDLKYCNVHFMSKSVLKIQNASTYADAQSEADEVNAVHLTGRMFRLTSVNPKVRKWARDTTSLTNIEWLDSQTGVVLQRGTNLASWDRGFNEVPLKQFFLNCSAASKVNLKPGGIKSDKVSYSRIMKMAEFIRVFTVNEANTRINNDLRAGKTNIIILEKQINVGTNPINLYYEDQKNFGVYITEGAPKAMVQDFYSYTLDKVA